jgi:hypothetical protein
MANIGQAKSDMDRQVKVKYIPIAGNYKNYSLPVSVMGDGKISKKTLRPYQWETVSVAVAKELQSLVRKSKRSRHVPDGVGMETAMTSDRYDQDDGGVKSQMREEGGEPDFEIQIDGTL